METPYERLLEASRTPTTERRPARRAGFVPADYAEKAMSSVMTLHGDLMAEKERSLDLTRRLMDERQRRAELESYVRLLEAEVLRAGGPDLASQREDRPDGVGRASSTVLGSLVGSPPVERAAGPAPAAPGPRPAPGPAPVPHAGAAPAAAVSAAPAAAVSAAPAAGVSAAPAPAPTAPPAVEPASAERFDSGSRPTGREPSLHRRANPFAEDGWRQW